MSPRPPRREAVRLAAERLEDRITPFKNAANSLPHHENITDLGLYFLREDVREEIRDANRNVDVRSFISGAAYLNFFTESDPGHHFDGSAFREGAQFINGLYDSLLTELTDPGALDDDDVEEYFGALLHPAQDFYSHTNWVEYVFGGQISLGTIVDAGLDRWNTLAPFSPVSTAPNVVFVEGPALPAGVTSVARSAPGFDVTVTFGTGEQRKGLISGDFSAWWFDEGTFSVPAVRVGHDDEDGQRGLNKDDATRGIGFNAAYYHAYLQTTHEFKRLISLIDADPRLGPATADRLLCDWVEPDQLQNVYRFLGRELPTAAVPVIDRSGSMDGGPLASAQDSASQFVTRQSDGSWLGVVGFSDGSSVVFPLTQLAAGSDGRGQARQAIAQLVAGGSTSIGAGLQAAYDLLADDRVECYSRSIIVLSDGEENTEPYAADVIAANDPSVRIFGIGFGSGADNSQLQSIATQRGGEFFYAQDVGDLAGVFARIAGRVNDEQDVLRAQGTIQPGSQVTRSFLVDPTTTQLAVGLSWPGSDLDLTLIDPAGRVYQTGVSPAGGRFIGGATSEYFELRNPAPGTWRVVAGAVDVEPEGERFDLFARVVSALNTRLTTDRGATRIGEQVRVEARVTEGAPLPGGQVLASVRRTDGGDETTRWVRLYDDGTHGDSVPGDGVFTSSFVPGHDGEGVYELAAHVTGRTRNGDSFSRLPTRSLIVEGNLYLDAEVHFAVAPGPGGGPVATRFDAYGDRLDDRTAFDFSVPGGVRVATADFNRDGTPDIVAGTGPGVATRVRVLDGKTGAELFAFDPFESSFVGGVYVATGDVDGDGFPDLAVTPDEGGGPRVRLFSGQGFTQIADFFGIDDPNFRGGARPALGDLNGDGLTDLLVAAGFGGGPRVAGFDAISLSSAAPPEKLFADFFAFEPALRNGAFIAAGDVNGDGYADVVGGGGPGGGPRVYVLSGYELVREQGRQLILANFFSGDVENRGGARVAVKDLDTDGYADILVGAGTGGTSRISAYDGYYLDPTDPEPYDELDFDVFPGFTGGVFIG